MTEHESPRDLTDAPRPNRRRRGDQRDPARVADNKAVNALHPGIESSYGAASAGAPAATRAPRTTDRSRAVAPRLTEPEIVPITPHQHQQAVTLLSAMIVSWLQRDTTPPVDPPEHEP